MQNKQQLIGSRAEEAIRCYFLSNGYYVCRGVKITHDNSDITDVDLWLYRRSSHLGRERANVDIKDKGKPKAIERILWAKGLQSVLKLDRSVVVTRDNRSSVVAYGQAHGVLIIDGSALRRIKEEQSLANSLAASRISEEDLFQVIERDMGPNLAKETRNNFEKSKSLLLERLNFDGCNLWLEDIRKYIGMCLEFPSKEAPFRLLYHSISLFLVGLDFATSPLFSSANAPVLKVIEEGLRYGNDGRDRIDRSLRSTAMLLKSFAPEQQRLLNRIRRGVEDGLSDNPVEILAQFFSRSENRGSLVDLARRFEEYAYEKDLPSPSQIPSKLLATLSIFLDYTQFSRSQFLDLTPPPTSATPIPLPGTSVRVDKNQISLDLSKSSIEVGEIPGKPTTSSFSLNADTANDGPKVETQNADRRTSTED